MYVKKAPWEMIKQNFKNINEQYLQNEFFSKITSSNIFLFWISSFKQNFKNFKRTTLEKCKYPNFGPEGLSFYDRKALSIFKTNLWSFTSKNHMNRKLIRYFTNNETLYHKLKTCIVNSTELYIHSAIFPLRQNVHSTTPPSPWVSKQKMQPLWDDLVCSVRLTQWLPHRDFSLIFQLSVLHQIFAFSFLSLPLSTSSDFWKSLFLLSWASFFFWWAFLQLERKTNSIYIDTVHGTINDSLCN